MRIVHIITVLGNGGAEGMLYRICKEQTSKSKLDIKIISLSSNDWYSLKFKKIGIKVYKINFQKNFYDFLKLIKLIKLIINLNPKVIQTWMYHSNLIGGIIGHLFTNANIYWNIRHTHLNIKYSKISTIFIAYFLSFFSYFVPSKIIYCSHRSKKVHENKFYDKKKSIFIPNGYDNTFYPSIKKRFSFRKKNKISKSTFVIGLAARFHPEKNFNNLIKAFNIFNKKNDNAFLFLKGKNVNSKNFLLKEYISDLPRTKYKLDNNPSNLVEFMNGIDLFVLPSLSESFPNVLAESMLCKTPAVSTNVGCAKSIISSTGGAVVATNDSFALLKALKKMHSMYKIKKKWNEIKHKSRNKIMKKYNIKKVSLEYEKLWNT